jgi:hypothetical protein
LIEDYGLPRRHWKYPVFIGKFLNQQSSPQAINNSPWTGHASKEYVLHGTLQYNQLTRFFGTDSYYNDHRVHASLNGNTPTAVNEHVPIERADLHNFRWEAYPRELGQPSLAG